jgi:uncharacterized damage-inducible protein DinB
MSENRVGVTSVLTSLFRHNTWANLKLLDFCAGLTDEQLKTTAVGAYGSLRATLAHMIGAEVDYTCRVTGKAPPAWLFGDENPGFDVLKDTARQAGEELVGLAVIARADTTVRETDPQAGLSVEYPLSSLLVQAINHATEHRQQVSAIITQLGLEPPAMDGWAYMEAMGEFREFRSGVESAENH